MSDRRPVTGDGTPGDETTVDEARVRAEHLGAVRESAHWLYLVAVLGFGSAAMLALIALLGSS